MSGLLSSNDPLYSDLSNISSFSFSNKVNQIVPNPTNIGNGSAVFANTIGNSHNFRTLKGVNGAGVSVVGDTLEISAVANIEGLLIYVGVWDAFTNVPDLLADDGLGGPFLPGEYYIVNVSGSTVLNGVSGWEIGDWVIRSSVDSWQKIDNSEKPINDTITSLNALWSSTKISSELNGKLNTGTGFTWRHKGSWNASSNSPNLLTASLTAGDYYIVTTSGSTNLGGISSWVIGDWVVWSDTFSYQRIINSYSPKITSNKFQVSDLATGWSVNDAGSFSIQQNNVPKFIISNNSTFLSGFTSGSSVSGILIPSGTTGQRVNSNGNIRYNTTTLAFEFYNGSWIAPTQNNSFSSVQGSDLNISGAVADQILGYTGSVWAPRFQSYNLSVGTGVATLKNTVLNGVSNYRSILAGANTNVSLIGDDIVISSSGGGSGEVNTAIGQGVGATIVGTKVGTVLGFKNLLQGSGIAISSDATDVTISSTLTPGETNTASSAGGTVSLVNAKVGVNLPFKGLTAGTNVTLTQNANDVVINASGGGETNTASSAGGTVSLVNTKVGVNLPFKGLTAGTNVTLTQNANDVVINATSGGAATTISIDPACPFISAFLVGSNYTLSARAAETIRIGLNAGGVSGTQNFGGVSIGDNSGKTSGVENLYFGPSSGGGTSTKSSGMALGILSGYNSLGTRATVIGFQSGFNATGDDSVAIGPYSGYSGTQPFTISIGNRANFSAPNVACIVINATSVALNGLNTTPGCFINPIANKTQAPESLYYNNTTKEVTFQKAGQQPSYTTAQRTALTGLTAGFLCYDSDLLQLGLWSGVAWRMI
jgi:hypothetical protein